MRTDRLAWSQVACDNLKKAGATDEIFYYRRVLGKEKYAAHVFIFYPHSSGTILLTLSLRIIHYSPILQKSMN